jgi:ankyrin repeat protein
MHHAPWRRAVETGDARRVELLLREPHNEHRFPLRARSDALEIAVSLGHADVLDLLLDAAPLGDQSARRCASLLRLAGFHGHKDAMWRLLKRMRIDSVAMGDQDVVTRPSVGDFGSRGHQDETTLRSACEEMLNAARRGDVETVRSILQQDALYAYCMDDATGETAFSVAFASGHRNVCERLLLSGAHAVGVCTAASPSNVNTASVATSIPSESWNKKSTVQSCSVVRRAVKERNAPLVRWLLAHGANVYTRAIDGDQSALSLAAYHSATEIVEILLAHGARLDESQCRWLALPPSWPIEMWDVTGTASASDSSMDPTSFFLLAIACYTQDRRFAQHLWTTQRDLKDRALVSEFGPLAFAIAIHRRDSEMQLELLERGARATEALAQFAVVEVDNVKLLVLFNAEGSGPQESNVAAQQLFIQAAQSGSVECARKMLENGVAHSTLAVQAFEAAVQHGRVDVARLLMEACELPLTSASISRCLEYAVDQQNLELLELLLMHPAATPSVVQNVFKEACLSGRSDAVALLLAHGVDVDMAVCSGMTFLLHQVLSKVGHGQRYSLTAKLLLEAGASLELVDSFGETPLAIVERRRAHIRTSCGSAQLAFVEDVLKRYLGNNRHSRRAVGTRAIMCSLNTVW